MGWGNIAKGLLLGLLVAAAPARADTAQTIATAVRAYHAGQVLDAEQGLEAALKDTAAPADRWALANLLMDICTHSYDFRCIEADWKLLGDASAALKTQDAAAKTVFVIAFGQWQHGNLDFFRQTNMGMDFSLRIATPADPVLAVRLYLLNAAVWQLAGDYARARPYIDRAFSMLLRIDPGKDGFDQAVLLKTLIQTLLQNHDAARALRWAALADPLIQSRLPATGFDAAEYQDTMLQLLEIAQGDLSDQQLETSKKASAAFAGLQINPDIKNNFLSELSISRAALYALRGDPSAAELEMQNHVLRIDRAKIIARGQFASFAELSYGAAEIFFDTLAGKTPDPAWRSLLQSVPAWTVDPDLADTIAVYRKTALALLEQGPLRAQLLKEAARVELANFAKGRADAQSFPLPNLLDRVVLNIVLPLAAQTPVGDDADLLLGGLEALDRNPRYVVSDTLSALAVQSDEAGRRSAHDLLRLVDERGDWERAQLQALVANRPAAADTTGDFDKEFAALASAWQAPPARLPTAADLQQALAGDEAFLGYAAGMKICVRRDRIQTARLPGEGKSFALDIKLLSNALTLQNAPSDALDSQYPVAAAEDAWNVLLGGLDDCLKGATQLIYLPFANAANVPLAALLRDDPPKKAGGYDLARAHWLARDYAVSNVTSIAGFLASRALARRPAEGHGFAGIGDPRLTGAALKDLTPLPETATEIRAIAALFSPDARATRLGSQATKAAFAALPPQKFEVLHFATHGLIRDDIPELAEAALVFTPAKDADDGLLSAGDIANLSLTARLAVLSACNTANVDGRLFTSQLQGLASAFAAAGVPTTVASLWPVDSDTSRRLMVAFYRHLLAGDGAAKALQEASVETIAGAPKPAFAHPRFWAPFIVLGDGGVHIDGKHP